MCYLLSEKECYNTANVNTSEVYKKNSTVDSNAEMLQREILLLALVLGLDQCYVFSMQHAKQFAACTKDLPPPSSNRCCFRFSLRFSFCFFL